MRFALSTLALAAAALALPGPAIGAATDDQVRAWAEAFAAECRGHFEQAIATGTLKENDVFDRLYVPVPKTDPPKFHTRYDAWVDKVIQPIEERYLSKDKRIVFVILVDRNGYLPSHNLKYCQPLTGDKEKDAVGNRTKRIFNDRTGITAARSTRPYLLQEYMRDNGEVMKDLSVPVRVKGRHWGAVRFGYR